MKDSENPRNFSKNSISIRKHEILKSYKIEEKIGKKFGKFQKKNSENFLKKSQNFGKIPKKFENPEINPTLDFEAQNQNPALLENFGKFPKISEKFSRTAKTSENTINLNSIKSARKKPFGRRIHRKQRFTYVRKDAPNAEKDPADIMIGLWNTGGHKVTAKSMIQKSGFHVWFICEPRKAYSSSLYTSYNADWERGEGKDYKREQKLNAQLLVSNRIISRRVREDLEGDIVCAAIRNQEGQETVYATVYLNPCRHEDREITIDSLLRLVAEHEESYRGLVIGGDFNMQFDSDEGNAAWADMVRSLNDELLMKTIRGHTTRYNGTRK